MVKFVNVNFVKGRVGYATNTSVLFVVMGGWTINAHLVVFGTLFSTVVTGQVIDKTLFFFCIFVLQFCISQFLIFHYGYWVIGIFF